MEETSWIETIIKSYRQNRLSMMIQQIHDYGLSEFWKDLQSFTASYPYNFKEYFNKIVIAYFEETEK